MVKEKYEHKFEDLRNKAEELLTEKKGHNKKLAMEVDELIHELEVYQIELEIQNENLVKAQVQLEESRKDYKELYDFAPVAYFTFDKNWVIKKTNLNAFEILGIPRKYLVNTAFIRYIARDSRKTFYDHCHEVKESQEKKHCELELLSPDKSPLFISLDSVMVLNDGGGFKEYRAIATDITDRKKMEFKIAESEKKFHLLFEESPLPYQSLDEAGNLLEVNPAWCACLGYSRDEVIGKNFADFLAPEYKEHFKENFLRFKDAGEIHGIEFQMKRKDGGIVNVAYEGRIGYDEFGHFKQTNCMFQDITERKETEKEIQEYTNQLKATIDAIPDLLFEVDAEGRFYDYNAPITDELYVPPEQFLGKKVSEVLPPEAADKIMEAIKEASEKGKHQGIVYELSFPEGTRYFELSIAKKPISKSKPHFIALVQDITERKEAEQKIKQSLHEKEILLKEIHHRVKNNLQVISSLLNLQSEYIKDKTDQELFRESQNRARSMALIHERLYQSTDLRRIDFGEYIQTLVSDLYRTYGCKPDNIKLKLDLERIMVDINTAIPCGLIINELMSNAIKHAFPDNRKGEINVKFYQKDHELILTVKDNGIGFPEDMEFRKTDSLGLRVVNTLVDQIGGEVEINSDDGAEFTVTFPEVKFD